MCIIDMANSIGSLMHHLWQKGKGLNQWIQHTHILFQILWTHPRAAETQSEWRAWRCGFFKSAPDVSGTSLVWHIRWSVRPFQHWWNRGQCLPQSSGFCGIIGHALLLIIATIGFQLITSLLPNVTAYSLVEGKLMIINLLPEEAAGPYSCILFLFCSWRRIIMSI